MSTAADAPAAPAAGPASDVPAAEPEQQQPAAEPQADAEQDAAEELDPGECPALSRHSQLLTLRAELQPFELALHLPARPLLPTGDAAAGLPEVPSPLRVAVTAQETLNDLRLTITDSPEGYWLGAFCFRRAPAAQSGSKANGAARNGAQELGERVPEWVELREVFKDVPREQRELHVAHGECCNSNVLEGRTHAAQSTSTRPMRVPTCSACASCSRAARRIRRRSVSTAASACTTP
jgi:hypothetical protein